MKRSKWPFFIAKKQIRINILKGGKKSKRKEIGRTGKRRKMITDIWDSF